MNELSEVMKFSLTASQLMKMEMPIRKKMDCMAHLLERAADELDVRSYTELRDTIDSYTWEMQQ